MPLLANVETSGNSPYKNFIVVPGFAGNNLSDRTCPHFDKWLGRIVVKCATSARSWVYNHGIRLEELESWDKYCTAGHGLLDQLLLMQDKLDEALIEAWKRGERDENRQLLDKIETIVLVGEPSLNPKKPDEWINLISKCVSRQRGLPGRLGSGATVGCLHSISDEFEDILFYSTRLDVSGADKAQPKRKFWLKKMGHDGCIIGCAAIHIRLFTTSSEEMSLDSGPEDLNICPFHPKSSHFGKLLMLDSTPERPQLEAPNGTSVPRNDDGNVSLGSEPESHTTLVHEREREQLPATTTNETVEAPNNENADVHLVSSAELHQSTQLESGVTTIEEIQVSNLDSPKEDGDLEDTTDTAEDGAENVVESSIEQPAAKKFVTRSAMTSQKKVGVASRRERKTYFSSSIPARDSEFFERSEILDQLEHTVLSTQDGNIAEESSIRRMWTNLVWITGLPGIGKTSIAVEFAYRFMERFAYVIWLDAASSASLGKSCHDSAVALGLINGRVCQDHQISRLRLMDFVRRSSSPWLLILDDCNDGVDISPYLVSNDGSCTVVATGRQQPPSASWSIVDVPPLTPEETTKFLARYVGDKVSAENVKEICPATLRIPFSPLVLRHVARWSARDTVSFEDINILFSGANKSLSSVRFKPIHDVMSCTMDRLDTSSTSLLVTLCFYDSKRMPDRLLRTSRLRKTGGLRRFDTTKHESTLSGATSSLWRSALLDVDNSRAESSYQMQKSVQDWIRTQVDDQMWRDGFSAACSSLSYQWPSKRKLKNIMGGFWEDFDNLHTHVHHLADCLTRDRLADQVSYDPGDQFKRLLVYHTWYNSRRGNQAEDRSLRSLIEFLLTTHRGRGTDDKGDRTKKSPHTALPRRSIMVMDGDEPTARLVDTHGCRAPYIALSYVWGAGSPSYRLNSSNLSKYKQGIDISTLPRQISDAIQFTRNMGVQYLWVDALCVDQDNPTEVSEELDRFVQYYSNSSMVICALQPSTPFSQLKWEPNQRLDIPPYSILRSGSLGDALAEDTWKKASTLRGKCFRSTASLHIQDTIRLSQSSVNLSSIIKKGEATPPGEPNPNPRDGVTRKSPVNTVKTGRTSNTIPKQSQMRNEQKRPPYKASPQIDEQSSAAHPRFEDMLVAYVSIVIFATAGFLRRAPSTLSESPQRLAKLAKENPWVMYGTLCGFVATVSFYLGSCMATTVLRDAS